MTGVGRHFLFLQGPHGPFFASFGAALRNTGARVTRIGFNAGDEALWRGPGFRAYSLPPENWPEALDHAIDETGAGDIVIYGAARPVHKAAARAAEARGLTLHVFEEGYLRPFWITYERGGANGSSPAMKIGLDQMARIKGGVALGLEPPDRWGDMAEHMFWGAVYHACLLAGSRRYPGFRTHRVPGVAGEARLHLRRFLAMPARRARRWLETGQVLRGGFPFHLVLLQLAHDANFLEHGPFGSHREFLSEVLPAFARGAPRHHHLVLKAHPLEDGREPLRPLVRELAERHGLAGRVHLISGGKLARLLGPARSAVTVNSTAAEQALWRGKPTFALGRAVYARPGLVDSGPLDRFFADPRPPDAESYAVYRRFLLATSQIPGGFYSRRGRRQLLRQLPDLMLASRSPVERALNFPAAERQQIRLVT